MKKRKIVFMCMQQTIELTKQLIACPSTTPDDAGCQEIISHRLKKLGFNCVDLSFDDTKNLWASYGNQGPHLVFAGHTDVVPPGNLSLWDYDPFTPTIHNNNLYGRGVADMKGGIAAMVVAVEEFIIKNPSFPGKISFLITSDEEGSGKNGTKKVIEQLKQDNIHIDWCIVGEPISQNTIADTMKRGSRGSLTGAISFFGKQGHVGYAKRANNPIHNTLRCLEQITKIVWDQKTPDFPASSLQITNIKSGVGAENVIPPDLYCQFNIRFSPEITPDHIKTKITELLKQQSLPYKIEWKLNGLPFLSKQGKLSLVAKKAVQLITNNTPIICSIGGTSDARFIVDMGCETLELGLLDTTIHAVNEHVACHDLEQLTKIYKNILELLFIDNNNEAIKIPERQISVKKVVL